MRFSPGRISYAVLVMFNFTEVNSKSSQTTQIVNNTLLTLIFLSFGVFLYFLTIILYVFFTNPHVQENSRYVLFIHMLINDAFMLSILIFLTLVNAYQVNIPVPICYALIVLSECSSRITPFNLAVMSLERFFAICYPLRHAEVSTLQRALQAIEFMWLLGLGPHLLEFIAICYSMPKDFFSTSVKCAWSAFALNEFQVYFMAVAEICTFALVGLVISFTYVRVMVVARKVGSGKSSAFKAEKTVLLHAAQLGLCLMSFTAPFTDVFLKQYYSFMAITNYFLFMHLPRIISPLIYGIRDKVFQKQMRKIKWLA